MSIVKNTLKLCEYTPLGFIPGGLRAGHLASRTILKMSKKHQAVKKLDTFFAKHLTGNKPTSKKAFAKETVRCVVDFVPVANTVMLGILDLSRKIMNKEVPKPDEKKWLKDHVASYTNEKLNELAKDLPRGSIFIVKKWINKIEIFKSTTTDGKDTFVHENKEDKSGMKMFLYFKGEKETLQSKEIKDIKIKSEFFYLSMHITLANDAVSVPSCKSIEDGLEQAAKSLFSVGGKKKVRFATLPKP